MHCASLPAQWGGHWWPFDRPGGMAAFSRALGRDGHMPHQQEPCGFYEFAKVLGLVAVGVPALIIGWQCNQWLQFGIWPPLPISAALSTLGIGIPQTEWVGAQQIIYWLVSLPTSLVIFVIIGVAARIVLSLEIPRTQAPHLMKRDEAHRNPQNPPDLPEVKNELDDRPLSVAELEQELRRAVNEASRDRPLSVAELEDELRRAVNEASRDDHPR